MQLAWLAWQDSEVTAQDIATHVVVGPTNRLVEHRSHEALLGR